MLAVRILLGHLIHVGKQSHEFRQTCAQAVPGQHSTHTHTLTWLGLKRKANLPTMCCTREVSSVIGNTISKIMMKLSLADSAVLVMYRIVLLFNTSRG